MNSSTVNRILREVLENQAPVVVCRSSDDKKKYLASLKKELKGLKTIDVLSDRGYQYGMVEARTELRFSIELSSSSRFYDTFVFCFDDEHGLCLQRAYLKTTYHFSGEIQQLETLVDRFKAEAEKQANKEVKAKKVKDLKTAAIMARIREIAVEDEFDFHYELMSTKVKLVVRIGKNGFIEIDIPFGQFQKKLQGIRDCIRLAREIGDLQVVRTIKYQGVEHSKWNWNSYEKLKNSQGQ